MSGGEAAGGKEEAVPVPADWRKLVQDLREIVNHPEAEIYATLRECGMDPDEAVSRLLSQDTFQEVKSKRGKKQEIKEVPGSRYQTKNIQGFRSGAKRGGRSNCGFYCSNDNMGPRPPVSGPGMASVNSSQRQTIANSSLQSSSGFRHGGWSGTPSQLLMYDIVKMGRPQGKASSKPVVTVDRVYAGQYPSLPRTNQNLKQSGSMVPSTELDNSMHSSSTDNMTSRPPVSGSGTASVNSSLRQTIASSSANKHMVTDGPAVSLQSSSGFEHGGWSGTANPHLDGNSTFAMRPAPASERHLEPNDGISEYNDGILKNSGSYQPHNYSYAEQEAEDSTTDVSVTAENLQSLSLHNDELAAKKTAEDYPAVIIPDHLQVTNTICASFSFGSFVYDELAAKKTSEDYPAVIIPDHLQVTNAVCASFSFGSFVYDEAFSGLLPQKTTDSNVEFPAREESKVDQIDARNQDYYVSSAVNSPAVDAPPVSQATELRPNVLDPCEYDMPSVSGHAYSKKNSSQASTIEDPQGNDLENLDCIMEIVSHTNVETVVCMASLCKTIRRFITHHSFMCTLNSSSRFCRSLYLGYFLSFRDNRHLRPQFVSTPFGHKLLAGLQSNLDSLQFRNELFDYAPFGSDGSYLVFREHIEPSLLVWNPLTKILVYLPLRHGITRRSSCILRVDGRSFKINLVKLRLNRQHLCTQSFTSEHNALTLENTNTLSLLGFPISGIWTDVSVRAVPGSTAKISKCNAVPVVLYGVCYWLCKCSGKYVVLKLELDTEEAPEFINVPVECSSTAQFHRNNILLVPTTGSRIGHIDHGPALHDDLDGRLGLIALDTSNFTVWMRSNTGDWERGAVISRERVTRSLSVLPRRKLVQLDLVWCAKASGILLINVAGCGLAVLNLNTLDAGFVRMTSVERDEPNIRIRNSCPFEFDFVSCLTSMKDF